LLVPAGASGCKAGFPRAFGQAFNGGFPATAAHIRVMFNFCVGLNGLKFDDEEFTSADYIQSSSY
jgi:hypothetical protein